jgi:hypothetical protein
LSEPLVFLSIILVTLILENIGQCDITYYDLYYEFLGMMLPRILE